MTSHSGGGFGLGLGLGLGNNGFASTFPHYAIHQGIPFNLYGYSSYSPDYTYPTPTNYYGMSTTSTQFPPMYGGSAFYPYLQFGETGNNGGGGGGGVHYSHAHSHLYHYSHPINSYHYASLTPPSQPGVTMTMPLRPHH